MKQPGPYLPQLPGGAALPRYTDVTGQAGLAGVEARRVAWGDIDNDGDADLLADGSVLLRNDGRDGFTDVSSIWGIKARWARPAPAGCSRTTTTTATWTCTPPGAGGAATTCCATRVWS